MSDSATPPTVPAVPAGVNLHPFLGLSPKSTLLSTALLSLSTSASLPSTPPPEVKAYPDVVYYNYHPLGISLLFHPKPATSYRPKTGTPLDQLELNKLVLGGVDIYNHEAKLEPTPSSPSNKPARPSKSSTLKPAFDAFPAYPLLVEYPSVDPTAPTQTLRIDPDTRGRDFVTSLGEPDRKGGGEGSLGIWTEWTGLGVMVEYASGGLQAWDKGGDAVWKVVSVFEKGKVAGENSDDDDE